MSLLDDFETLEQQQVNSIEYYLRQMVIKDRYPIAMDFDVFCQEYFKFSNYDHWYDPNERLSNERLYSCSNLIGGRVYIAAGIDKNNVTKLASEYRILIGTIDEGFRKITEDDLHQYIQLYKEQWPDCDYIYEFEHTLRKMRYGTIQIHGYNTIAVEDHTRGFNFEMIY